MPVVGNVKTLDFGRPVLAEDDCSRFCAQVDLDVTDDLVAVLDQYDPGIGARNFSFLQLDGVGAATVQLDLFRLVVRSKSLPEIGLSKGRQTGGVVYISYTKLRHS